MMVTDMGGISTNHNPNTIPTTTGAAVSKGTYHTLHPTTTAAHATLGLTDSPLAIHAMTHPTGKVTTHPTPTTSPTDVTHATIPQTGASLTPTILTALHRKHSQETPRHSTLSYNHKPHHSKTVTIQDSPSDSFMTFWHMIYCKGDMCQ